MSREGIGDGHCASNLEGLGVEHAYEHAKGASADISHAGSETTQTCIQICSEYFRLYLIFTISLLRVLKHFTLSAPH